MCVFIVGIWTVCVFIVVVWIHTLLCVCLSIELLLCVCVYRGYVDCVQVCIHCGGLDSCVCVCLSFVSRITLHCVCVCLSWLSGLCVCVCIQCGDLDSSVCVCVFIVVVWIDTHSHISRDAAGKSPPESTALCSSSCRNWHPEKTSAPRAVS